MVAGVEIPCPSCAATNSVDPARLSSGPKCGRCGEALVANGPIEVSDDQLAALIASAKVPVFVDFWATWCPPCRAIAPHVHDLAKRYAGKLVVAKVDTDRHQRHMAQLGIRSIPTLAIYKAGSLVHKQAGAVGGAQLDRMVAPHL